MGSSTADNIMPLAQATTGFLGESNVILLLTDSSAVESEPHLAVQRMLRHRLLIEASIAWCYMCQEASAVFMRVPNLMAGLRSLQESCVSYAAYCSLPQGACPF